MSVDLTQLPEIKELKPKQRSFVLDYIVTGKQTEAARKAGYAKGCAAVTASKLLTYAKIQDAIRACEQAVASENELTVEWISKQIQDIAEDKTAKAQDRLRALELLGRYKGMFKDMTTNIAVFGDQIGSELVQRIGSIGQAIDIYRVDDTSGSTADADIVDLDAVPST